METVKIGTRGTMLHFVTGESWNLNCYLIEGKRFLYIVDTGRGAGDAIQIKEYVEKHFEGKSLIVINTHWHFDHVWGNSVFADCPIIAQRECYKMYCDNFDRLTEEYAKKHKEIIEYCPPTFLVEETLYIEDDGLILFHTSGHTPDGLAILDKDDRVLYIGDNIGDTAEEPVPYLEQSKATYKTSLEYIKTLDFDLLASGHNEIQTKAFIDKILLLISSQIQ
ncbi:MAG: MBL fold metallo-hydrolase [Clostridia bacterium]|nr:MBL fold metallo-hydrolase [Clostridia bacterium]